MNVLMPRHLTRVPDCDGIVIVTAASPGVNVEDVVKSGPRENWYRTPGSGRSEWYLCSNLGGRQIMKPQCPAQIYTLSLGRGVVRRVSTGT